MLVVWFGERVVTAVGDYLKFCALMPVDYYGVVSSPSFGVYGTDTSTYPLNWDMFCLRW